MEKKTVWKKYLKLECLNIAFKDNNKEIKCFSQILAQLKGIRLNEIS